MEWISFFEKQPEDGQGIWYYGEMIGVWCLITSMVPVFAPSLIMTFEFFIGLIQAFVFGMLTLVFISQATQGHGDGEHHE